MSDDLQEISPNKFNPPVYGMHKAVTKSAIKSFSHSQDVNATSDQTVSQNDSDNEIPSYVIENEGSVVLF